MFIPDFIANIASIIFAIIFVSDIFISFKLVNKLKNVKFNSKDSTDELKDKPEEFKPQDNPQEPQV